MERNRSSSETESHHCEYSNEHYRAEPPVFPCFFQCLLTPGHSATNPNVPHFTFHYPPPLPPPSSSTRISHNLDDFLIQSVGPTTEHPSICEIHTKFYLTIFDYISAFRPIVVPEPEICIRIRCVGNVLFTYLLYVFNNASVNRSSKWRMNAFNHAGSRSATSEDCTSTSDGMMANTFIRMDLHGFRED